MWHWVAGARRFYYIRYMKHLIIITCLVNCLLLAACRDRSGNWKPESPPAPKYEPDTNAIRDISLIALIANPEKYAGKKIRVKGFIHLEFEANELFVNKEDYTEGISKNAICIDYHKVDVPLYRKFSDHYVIVEGIFSSKMLGHDAANSGAIRQIARMDFLNSRNSRRQPHASVTPKP